MNVEIINVGTELLLGEIVNTNATRILKMCRELGFDVYYQSVVGDNPKRLYDCIDLAFNRGAHCVITTGGLGPTTDDLTKELSAQYLGLELVYNEDEAKKVDEKCCFITNLSSVPNNNFKQAYFPKDAYVLENLMGTANGCVMEKEGRMIINLPGPPKELEYVINESLMPYLMKYKQKTIYTYDYMTMFIGESLLDEKLADLIDNQEDISIALYAHEETVRIRLALKAMSQEEANERIKDISDEIKRRIGKYLVDKDLKEAFFDMGKTIAFRGDVKEIADIYRPYLSDNPDIMIDVKILKSNYGQRVIIHYNDENELIIPVFMDARLHYGKIEARFIAQLYKYALNIK